ncbi:MAG: DUF1428 domain-containing protein [Pseudomonadota bacterium]
MYVNTYVLAVPEASREEYIHKASQFAEVAKDFGALEIFENWELEVPDGEMTDYRKAVQALPDERIVVAWTIWPDRETGARAHKGMFDDERMQDIGQMPTDGKRMILGGFEPVYHYRRESA